MEEVEEYELIPVNPIRKLERKIEDLEKSGGGTKINQELLDMARINQEIVDDLVKTNAKLSNKVSEMVDSVERLVTKLDAFMERVEIIGEGEVSGAEAEKREEKMDKMEKRLNALILSQTPKTDWRRLRERAAARKGTP